MNSVRTGSKPKAKTRSKNKGLGLPPFGGDVKQYAYRFKVKFPESTQPVVNSILYQ